MNYSKEDNLKKRKTRTQTPKKVKNKTGLIIFRVLLALVLIGGFAGAGAVFGAYFGIIQNAPTLSVMDIQPDIFSSAIINKKSGQETVSLKGEENRQYVTADQIPEDLKNAFVAIEDERFYSHNGIDLKGILRAAYEALSGGQQGASTITQQLIKASRDIGQNTIETKLQEQYLAIQYEKAMTEQMGGNKKAAKDRILELYMNTIALGHNLNGVQTAAKYYFDKEVSDLTLSECAVISGITQHPVKYSPINNPEENEKRRERVLNKMLELKMITQSQYDAALADDVYARISESEQITISKTNVLSFYDDQLITEVVRDLQDQYHISSQEAYYRLYNSGLQIISNQDLDMQAIMDEAFLDDQFFPAGDFEIDIQYYYSVTNKITGKTNHAMKKGTVKTEDAVKPFIENFKNEILGANDEIPSESETVVLLPQPQAGMVIMDYHTGEVKAIAGGRGQKIIDRAFNRATEAKRQPGSVFKVLASFAPAIDMGKITPATVIDDVPFTYSASNPPYSPRNHWGSTFRGLYTIRDGIKDSANIVTVKNMINTGIDSCFDYLLNFGFTTLRDPQDRVPSAALGGITDGVTQLELAAAYGAIANQGQYVKPAFYDKVIGHDGSIVLESTIEPKQILKKTSAYLLTDMMKSVITAGTGGQARFKQVKMPIAGKTGTTTDSKDLFFTGYTPYYVASIYMGFDMPKLMNERNGHMRLWSSIMEPIHENLEYKDFERPEGIVSASVCRDSGKLPVAGLCDSDPRGSRIRSEIFAAGTQPTDYCDVHISVIIDSSTGMKATEYCPEDLLEPAARIVRPTPYEGDAVVEDSKYEAIKMEECNVHGLHNEENPAFPDDIYTDPFGYEYPIISNPEPEPSSDFPATPSDTPAPSPDAQPAPSEVQSPVIPEPTPTPASEPPSEPPSTEPVIDEPTTLDRFEY